MRRLVVVAILIGCLSSVMSASAQSADRSEIDALMAKWLHALNTENISDYASCYWDDATVLGYDTAGNSGVFRGINAIRAHQQQWFDGADYAAMNLTYSPPDRFTLGSPTSWVYVYDNSERYRFIEAFYFERRSGEYRIVHQFLISGVQIP